MKAVHSDLRKVARLAVLMAPQMVALKAHLKVERWAAQLVHLMVDSKVVPMVAQMD